MYTNAPKITKGTQMSTPRGINARFTVADESWAAQYVQPKTISDISPNPNISVVNLFTE